MKEATSEKFIEVKNGYKLKKIVPIQPISLTNKFSSLPGLQETVDKEVRVVGDSITRELLSTYCGRNATKRKRDCFPGARVSSINNNISEFTTGADNDTTYIVHAGTNDLSQKNLKRKELLSAYRSLIKDLKQKSNNLIISGILPRYRCDYSFLNDAFNINRELKWICQIEGVTFINAWDSFYNIPDMYAADGLHLNMLGSTRLGRIFNEATKKFFSGKR
jgi:hypothetical protein